MKVVLQDGLFDPYQATRDYEDQHLPKGKHGAVVTFVGTMRDFNDGHDVSSMFLEHYPGMTEKHIENVCREALEKWDVIDALVVHRHGEIAVTEPIVLVAVWSAHRAHAFDACRYIINYLKERAPFWKCESTAEGKRWVERNTEDPGVNAGGMKRSA
ncbi:MAG TPA: molybdenum cofactor biosynthesis protein MoaE [Gammaproteobacteria bacterium]|nr:molybdenum cofactor biosynthesis protein MoaE [Gammaproteobacteria bacterium]